MSWAAVEGLGRAWAEWLLDANGWALAVLALALLCDVALARRVAPRWRMALYALVFVRVIVPEGWSAPWSLMPGASAPVSAAAPSVATTAIAHASPVVDVLGTTASVAATPSMSWGTALLSLHAIVALALLAVGVRRTRALAELRRSSRPVDLGADVPTRVHASAGPLAMGIRSPLVVLPAAALELPADELAAIVAHEGAHLRHRDPVLQVALIVACALLWPVVATWLAAARLRTLMEIRADEAVTRALDPRATRRYGELLLRVAADGLHGTPALGLGAAQLGARLKALRHRRTTSTLAQASAVLLAAATSATLVARRSDVTLEPTTIPRAAQALAARPEACLLDRAWRSPGTPAAKEAEARFTRAHALIDAGDLRGGADELAEAAWHAATARYDDLVAVATAELAGVHARLDHVDEALTWAVHADAAFRRAEQPLRAELAFRIFRADLLALTGDTETAARELPRVALLSAMAETCPTPAAMPATIHVSG